MRKEQRKININTTGRLECQSGKCKKHGSATEFAENALYADQVDTTTTSQKADTKTRQFRDPFFLMEIISRNTLEHAQIQPLERKRASWNVKDRKIKQT